MQCNMQCNMQCKMRLRVIVDPTNVVSFVQLSVRDGLAGMRSWLAVAQRWMMGRRSVRRVEKLLISLPLPSQRPRFRSRSLLRNPRRTALVNQCVGAGWAQITREESHLSNPRWSSSPLVLSAWQSREDLPVGRDVVCVGSEMSSIRSHMTSYLNNVRSQRTYT